MVSPDGRADDLADRLTAAGLAPRVLRRRDHITVEAHVPDSISPATWREVLTALESADWFGQFQSTRLGLNVWAGITRRDAPAAAGTARGLGHQLQGADERARP